jgi:opacity protein-like surface antigen
MKRLLAITLLLTLSAPAFAGQMYGAFSLGHSSESDLSGAGQTASGPSYSALFGFHIDRNFAYEVGFTSLFSDADISNAAGKKTIKGLEFAGVASYPLGGRFSAYARIGYSNLDVTNSAGPVVSNLVGFVYGAGLQYDINEEMGVRTGYKIFNLTSQTGDAIVNNAYVAMLYNF